MVKVDFKCEFVINYFQKFHGNCPFKQTHVQRPCLSTDPPLLMCGVVLFDITLVKCSINPLIYSSFHPSAADKMTHLSPLEFASSS